MNLPQNYDSLSWKARREVREEYVRLQGGLCWHCNAHLLLDPTDEVRSLKLDMRFFPEGFLNNPIHLHHDHRTGMTIGAVHAKCNGVLWQYFGQ